MGRAISGHRVLVVDDNQTLVEALIEGLRRHGYDVVGTSSSREAARRLVSEELDALVTDLRMPEPDGLQLLATSRAAAPERPVIVMTAFSAVDTALESVRLGAYHYLTKPFKVEELSLFLGRALEESALRRESATLRRALNDRFSFSTIIGRSGALREVCDLAERLADAETTLLITGETGTGKGLFARALHGAGARASGPFVMLNCAAVPEALLESELFGHVRGAFTGAVAARRGLFAEASGGTLFLDEVGELSPGTQAKLLHALERRSTRPVGSDREQPTDVRIIAATNRNLRERVAAGAFREDLLFRLNVVELEVPPLRHRAADLPALIAHFLAAARARSPRTPVVRFSPAALGRMFAYPWPGNVRELENLIERVVLLGGSEEVGVADLSEAIRVGTATPGNHFDGAVKSLQAVERDYARWALEQLGGRKLATAEKLEIDRKTLNRLLEPPADEAATRPDDTTGGVRRPG